MKRVLFDILGSRRVTEEVLGTTLSLVEQALKTRPITHVSTDSRELEALTLKPFFAWTTSHKLSFAFTWAALRSQEKVCASAVIC